MGILFITLFWVITIPLSIPANIDHAIILAMSISVIESFLSEEDVAKLNALYSEHLVRDEQSGYLKSNEVLPDAEQVVSLIKKHIEQAYDVEILGYDFFIAKMLKGHSNGLHSDTSDYSFGDEAFAKVGISALLYLSESGKDFTGGELVFPQHETTIEPKSGSLVFFKGDRAHRHGVAQVLSGERTSMVLFF